MTAIYDTMQFVKPQVGTVCLGQGLRRRRFCSRLARRVSGSHCPCADPDPPAVHRGGGQGLGHRDQANEILRMRAEMEESFPSHRPYGGADQKDIEARQDPLPKRPKYGVVDQVISSRKTSPDRGTTPNASGVSARHAARQANSRGTVETGTRCQYPRKGQLVARIGEGRTC